MVHARDYELPKVSEYPGTVVLSSSVFHWNQKGRAQQTNKQTKSYRTGTSNDSGTLPAAAALLGGPSLINLPVLISKCKTKKAAAIQASAPCLYCWVPRDYFHSFEGTEKMIPNDKVA